MSKKFITLSLIAFLAVGITSSCKYEEGPFISLRSKKERVVNTWQIEKIIEDDGDEKSGDDVPDTEYTYSDDDTYKVDGNKRGKWKFTNSQEEININFNYPRPAKNWTILKLKEKEMWLKNDDGDEYHYEPA